MAERTERIGRLRQVKPKGRTLRFQWNPESVTATGGVGGWREVERPQLPAALEWAGRPLRRLTFTLWFDGWAVVNRRNPDATHESVEADCRVLRDMAEPRAPRKPPPELEFDYGITGGGRWVIESIDTGPELRNGKLERIRAEFTITLVEFKSGDIALSPAKKNNENNNDDDGGGRAAKRIYVVKRGDTLPSIAASELGDWRRWSEIAKLNDLRGPKSVKKGDRIRLPRS